MPTVLVTGSSGLVGSACVRHFDALGWEVHGLDNNSRLGFFGRDGDTNTNTNRLVRETGVVHHYGDVRERGWVNHLLTMYCPGLVIHAAAQPSHDLAAQRPFDDFEINAAGTLNLLEATRKYCPDAPFVFLSTNKVYGDAPNRLPRVEHATRFDFDPASPAHRYGIGEWMSVDRCLHSLFGCSKLAADLYVQEYGRYFGMKTCALRCGCLTGGAHAGAEQHGFLAYLAKCVREGRPYKVYGHNGKQVRDQLHAADVATACEEFWKNPRAGEVYNLGGGYANSVSVREAIAACEKRLDRTLPTEYLAEPRKGDHVVYYSDCARFQAHYPDWKVTRSLDSILDELCGINEPIGAVS